MKKINLSILHLLIVIVTFMFTFAKGQIIWFLIYVKHIIYSPRIYFFKYNQSTDRPEIIAYQLVPGRDNYCHFEIQIVEGFGWNDIPDYQREETKEIIIDRIVFEEINPWAVNDMFYIDEKPYYLLRIPFQGWEW